MKSPAGPDPRRHRPQPGRGVHPGRGQRDARRHGEPDEGSSSRSWRPPLPPRRRRRPPRPGDGRETGPRRRRTAHRRASSAGPAILEKLAVRAYAATTWVVAHVPAALVALGDRDRLAGRLPVPGRRSGAGRTRTSATSSGLPPDHPRVRRLALARIANTPATSSRSCASRRSRSRRPAPRSSRPTSITSRRSGEASKGGLIFALGHVGNNEAVAAAVAARGWPINVVADDSSFPEMFERFRRLREAWGVHVIPWRNLREIYAVLRRREMLALLIDWGYRADGIPVRLFGAWTTLPAGPATLAAKTGSRILPVAIRRTPDGLLPRLVRAGDRGRRRRAGRPPAGDPGRSPTPWPRRSPRRRSSGTASSRCGRRRAEEAAELEQRAAAMLADDRPRGWARPRRRRHRFAAVPAEAVVPAAAIAAGGRQTRDRHGARRRTGRSEPSRRTGVAARIEAVRRTAREAIEKRDADRGTLVQRIRAAALSAISSWLACRLPEGPADRPRRARRAGRVPGVAGASRTRPAQPPARRRASRRDRTWPTDRIRAAAADPRALERLVRAAFRHHARYYLEILRAPGLDARIFDERLVVENPDVVDAALAGDRTAIFISGHLGPIELPGLYLAQHSGRRITAPMETLGDPALQRWFERTRATFGVRIVGLREARRELLGGAAERRVRRARRRPRHHRRRASRCRSSARPRRCRSGRPSSRSRPACRSTSRRRLAGRRRAATAAASTRSRSTREGARRERIAATLAAEARGVRAGDRRRPGAVDGDLLPDLAGPRGGAAADADDVRLTG